jgi:hypothetical protein
VAASGLTVGCDGAIPIGMGALTGGATGRSGAPHILQKFIPAGFTALQARQVPDEEEAAPEDAGNPGGVVSGLREAPSWDGATLSIFRPQS